MREHRDDIEAMGGQILGVAPATSHQAERLMQEHGGSIPLLLDPDTKLRAAAGLGRMRYRDWLSPTMARDYARSLGKGRQGRIPMAQLDARPGVLVIDPVGRLVWRYEGRALADYPEIGHVLDRLERLTS